MCQPSQYKKFLSTFLTGVKMILLVIFWATLFGEEIIILLLLRGTMMISFRTSWILYSLYYIRVINQLNISTALFGKVYRTIFQSNKVRDADLSSKQGSIMYIQNDTRNNFKYVFTYIYIYYIIKHNMNILCEFEIACMLLI